MKMLNLIKLLYQMRTKFIKMYFIFNLKDIFIYKIKLIFNIINIYKNIQVIYVIQKQQNN